MSAKYLLITCLLLALIPQSVFSQDVVIEALMTYNKWRFSNKRTYMNDDEQIFRQSVFFDNLKKIASHKLNKEATYEVGLNQFSDMTDEEFAQKILNSYLSQQEPNKSKRVDGENLIEDAPRGGASGFSAPQSVDWRTKGVVTAIKNQGSCGSCWTFSTVGILESFNAIKNAKLVNFSEQQLLDCVSTANGYTSYGCSGGWPVQALTYASMNGVLLSSQYPYIGYQARCRVSGKQQGFYPKQFYKLQQSSEHLKAALASSPVSVLVNASYMGSYRSGVFNGCGSYTYENQLNHAVVAVGYDAYGNWIIKNSWGTGWGESGYMRLAAGNTCGVLINNYAINA